MARREAGVVSGAEVAAAAAPAATPAPGNTAPVATVKEAPAQTGKVGEMAAEAQSPLVIKWKPPEAEGESEPVEQEASPVEEATEAAPAEGDAPPVEEEKSETDESAPPAEPPKPKARAIIERLRAEKARRAAEEAVVAERSQRQALEQKLAQFTSGSLGARLAALGITTEEQRQELAEAILLGKSDVVLPEASPPTVDARVAELEKRLRDEEQAKQQMAAQQSYQQMHGAVLNITSDMDLGVVKAVEKIVGAQHADGSPAGTHLVTAVAKQMWEQAGRPADSRALVRKAAERVVEHYRTQYPEVFAANQPAAAPAVKRPAMGQRVAPKPGATGRKLPVDRDERDEAIKREFGW